MSFHQFDAFTGRLKQSTQLEALSPLQPHLLEKLDPPKMMFDSIKTKVATTADSNSKNYSTLDPKIAKTMKKYQADLSKPTYLLRGKPDKMLLGITATLIAAGFVGNMISLWELKKKY